MAMDCGCSVWDDWCFDRRVRTRDRAMWVKRLLSSLLPFFKRREYCCSFCNSPQSAVRKLIAGSSAFICDECAAVCYGLVAQDATSPGERPRSTGAIHICLVC